jgi:prolyl oligopeptidase
MCACTAEDIIVLKDSEHPDWMWSAGVSEIDGRYLTVYISKDSSRVRTPCIY